MDLLGQGQGQGRIKEPIEGIEQLCKQRLWPKEAAMASVSPTSPHPLHAGPGSQQAAPHDGFGKDSLSVFPHVVNLLGPR